MLHRCSSTRWHLTKACLEEGVLGWTGGGVGADGRKPWQHGLLGGGNVAALSLQVVHSVLSAGAGTSPSLI